MGEKSFKVSNAGLVTVCGYSTKMPSGATSKVLPSAGAAFTACAAMEGAPANVRVNAIVPGQVMTAATADWAQKAGDAAQRTMAAIPMQRGGEPNELAEAIVFLLSDAASYITGQTINVDGGFVMHW